MRKDSRSREGQGDSGRGIFHLLVHSPNGHNSQVWVGLKSGAPLSTRAQALESPFATTSGPSSRNWIANRVPRLELECPDRMKTFQMKA